MEKLKILVNGCNGKMGQELVHTILENQDLEVIAGFDQTDLGIYNFPVYTKIEEIKNIPDVVIDFSVPIATFNILNFAKQHKIPTVIATTGFTNEQIQQIENIAKSIPIFQSSNMSFDIFLMQKILKLVATNLPNTDIEIIETHHNRKIDSPSGTALMLADSINQASNNKYHYNFNRFQERKKRDENEIGFSSIRGGNIVGEHTVKFIGPNETFEITHTSYSRRVFAEGSIRAARFLINKPCKLYHMEDLVKQN